MLTECFKISCKQTIQKDEELPKRGVLGFSW